MDVVYATSPRGLWIAVCETRCVTILEVTDATSGQETNLQTSCTVSEWVVHILASILSLRAESVVVADVFTDPWPHHIPIQVLHFPYRSCVHCVLWTCNVNFWECSKWTQDRHHTYANAWLKARFSINSWLIPKIAKRWSLALYQTSSCYLPHKGSTPWLIKSKSKLNKGFIQKFITGQKSWPEKLTIETKTAFNCVHWDGLWSPPQVAHFSALVLSFSRRVCSVFPRFFLCIVVPHPYNPCCQRFIECIHVQTRLLKSL